VILLAQVVPGHGALHARFVAVELDVVARDLRRRAERENAVGGDPLLAHDTVQHLARFVVELARCRPDHRVVEDLRECAR
jgi:hypothetical protein